MENSKSYYIAKFLQKNKCSRKDLIRFIICDLNKKHTYKEFNKIYSKRYRGHYGTNIVQWERLGNITRKNGVYTLTKQCVNNDFKLYSVTDKIKIKNLQKKLKLSYKNNRDLFLVNHELNKKLNKINYIINS